MRSMDLVRQDLPLYSDAMEEPLIDFNAVDEDGLIYVRRGALPRDFDEGESMAVVDDEGTHYKAHVARVNERGGVHLSVLGAAEPESSPVLVGGVEAFPY